MSQIALTIYHLRPLPQSLRSTFRLRANPYEILDKPDDRFLKAHVIGWLRGLGVIHYRDNKSKTGTAIVLLEEHEFPQEVAGLIKNNSDLSDFTGKLMFKSAAPLFRSSCIADVMGGAIRIAEVSATTDSAKIGRMKRIKTKGDAYHWIYWNNPVSVLHLNHAVVQTEKS